MSRRRKAAIRVGGVLAALTVIGAIGNAAGAGKKNAPTADTVTSATLAAPRHVISL